MNIVLIGMPTSGKSTIGKYLSESIGLKFIDTDKLVEEKVGMNLPDFIKKYGRENFKKFEKEAILSIKTSTSIISTGGSVIYEPEIMQFLQSLGTVVYLNEKFEVVRERLAQSNRVLMVKEGQTLQELYNERAPLYEKYANCTIHVNEKSNRDIFNEIATKLFFII